MSMEFLDRLSELKASDLDANLTFAAQMILIQVEEIRRRRETGEKQFEEMTVSEIVEYVNGSLP